MTDTTAPKKWLHPTKVVAKDFAVVIELPLRNRWARPGDPPYSFDDLHKRAKDLQAQIKRHVDLEADECLTVRIDAPSVCAFCELDPEADENGCPMCCSKAQLAWSDATGNEL